MSLATSQDIAKVFAKIDNLKLSRDSFLKHLNVKKSPYIELFYGRVEKTNITKEHAEIMLKFLNQIERGYEKTSQELSKAKPVIEKATREQINKLANLTREHCLSNKLIAKKSSVNQSILTQAFKGLRLMKIEQFNAVKHAIDELIKESTNERS